MAETSSEDTPGTGYALGLADSSYEWYRRAAIKARSYFRLSETLQLLISATIPVVAVLVPGDARVPAVLGAVLMVLTGLRSVFHWHDDYIRFSIARETVEAERRLYLTRSVPYHDDSTRDQRLASMITMIERQEMDAWTKIASPVSESKSTP
ncbi:DUF4231 domain-containing protein [Nonomuraea guangzhouensis]|uniref:DUF4231 domain-containing protein n=1 Tax=Nonomuraea guangzhouensis TaxID=1291555 RepID=A0ABW4GH30_9ACTN|nr:DUF4231 domain-containing protein [Nonomuraea guangzhouensis]